MNILVTGANGQLGREIRNASSGSGHRFIFTDISQAPDVETVYLDITNADAIRIICRSEDIDVIAEAKAYYKEVFGIDLTDEQAQSIFEPVQSAGEGFAYQ